MIDIHPPQHGAMTRRDFFVHLGIVVLGILIAIGLEQAVEAVHHRGQRNDLIRQMRTESQHNLTIFQTDQRLEIVQIAWFRSCLSALIHATPHQNSIDVTLPLRQPTPPLITPEHATWAIATTNGTVALLSDNLAEIYQRLDLDAERSNQAQTNLNDSSVGMAAVSARLGLDLDPGATLHLSLADRDLLLQALSRVEADWSQVLQRDAFWQGAADAVAHDVSSRDAMVPYLRQASSSAQQAEIQAGIPVSASARAVFHPSTPAQVHIP
ncbi:MAG TPA: hypothetical protein VGM11_05990 [Acidobacteriaceae bacterium]|jgi:hypothetical protein